MKNCPKCGTIITDNNVVCDNCGADLVLFNKTDGYSDDGFADNFFAQIGGVVSVELEHQNPEPTLPSEFTPGDLKITELFIKGTEPTTVSARFKKLEDISNLTVKEEKGTITLTWDKVKDPEINDKDYLTKYFDPVFETDQFLNEFVENRLNYNKNHLGTLGYNVYKKDSAGNLELLDFVSNNAYTIKVTESGEYSYVVKTAYSIFKSNMSDGKSTTIKVTISKPETDKETNTETNKEDKKEENSTN